MQRLGQAEPRLGKSRNPKRTEDSEQKSGRRPMIGVNTKHTTILTTDPLRRRRVGQPRFQPNPGLGKRGHAGFTGRLKL